MTIYKNLKLKWKLVSLVVLPIVCMLYFAQVELRSGMAILAENKKAQQLAQLSVLSSDLVHEIQKERGFTAGFLSSRGALFNAELDQQRTQVDEKTELVNDFLNGFDKKQFGSEFEAQLDGTLSLLAEIESKRSDISSFGIAQPDAIAYYSSTNNEFLSTIGFLVEATAIGEFRSMATGYLNFLYSKEQAGIERAVLVGVFAEDQFVNGSYARFLNLVNTQDIRMQVFLSLATDEQLQFYADTMRGEFIDETNSMRQIALDRVSTGGFGVVPNHWFEMQTGKINLLKSVESKLSNDLSIASAGYSALANTVLLTTMITTAFCLIASVIFIMIAQKIITRPILSAAATADAISHGRLDNIIDTSLNDEVGKLLQTLNKMQQSLIDRLERGDDEKAAENGRIRQGLDTCQANVLLADKNQSIVYANEAVMTLFGKYQARLVSVNSGFELGNVVGCQISELAGSESLIAGLTEPHEFRVEAAGLTFDVSFAPMIDENGERIGTVVEWRDQTDELARLADEKLRDEERALQKEKLQAMDKILADENARVKQALDVCQANVMVADADLNIVYTNDSVTEMMGKREQKLQQFIPSLDAASLMGSKVHALHTDPVSQKRMIENLSKVDEQRLVMAGLSFDLTTTPMFDEAKNRLGTVIEWKDVTESLARQEQEKTVADENGRVRQALDGAASNMLLTDPSDKIIYMNNAVSALFGRSEKRIRQDLPHFSTAALLGSKLESLIGNSTQASAASHAATANEINLGGLTFKVTISQLSGAGGERLGAVVELEDRTQELAIEDNVQNMVQSALDGDLSQRIPCEGQGGFIEMLSTGINELVAVCEGVTNETIAVLSNLSNGDLTRKIQGQYKGSFHKLQEDANLTVDRLTEVVSNIKDASESVATGAHEIFEGNTNLSNRTEQQASSLEETASSMEEMTSTVQQNAKNAREADKLALVAREKAEQGGTVVGNAVSAMAEINKSSKHIADIISVIDEIAFQTNLLALNASVEAARAGEQGRGFSVVASEVRNLAGRSAAAAKEIKELIQDSLLKVTEGSKLVDESGQTLEEIIGAVKKVTDIVGEISAASEEQASGIEEVNKSITQMDEMTQQNAALVEEAAAASEAMGDRAKDLSNQIQFFSLGSEATPMNSSEERRTQPRPWANSELQKPTVEAVPSRPKVDAVSSAKKLKSAGIGGTDWEEF